MVEAFDSIRGVPSPFGMTPLDELAFLSLCFTAWKDFARHMTETRDLEARVRASEDAASTSPAPNATASAQGETSVLDMEPPATISGFAQAYSESMGPPGPVPRR